MPDAASAVNAIGVAVQRGLTEVAVIGIALERQRRGPALLHAGRHHRRVIFRRVRLRVDAAVVPREQPEFLEAVPIQRVRRMAHGHRDVRALTVPRRLGEDLADVGRRLLAPAVLGEQRPGDEPVEAARPGAAVLELECTPHAAAIGRLHRRAGDRRWGYQVLRRHGEGAGISRSQGTSGKSGHRAGRRQHCGQRAVSQVRHGGNPQMGKGDTRRENSAAVALPWTLR